MAKATPEQYQTAIDNYRRTAALHRNLSITHPIGSWRTAADLRVAAKADAAADELEARMRGAI